MFEACRHKVSNIRPSEWAEKYRVMSSEVSPFPGPFRYDRTPYTREIVDTFMPDHPARVIGIQKGGQIGLSVGFIETAIGWIISENPGNILLLSGHAELAEEGMNTKIDQMIESCGLRPLIRPNVIKKKNARTGDTSKSKEFPGGSLVAGSASNHKLLMQRSIRYAFVDDFDAVPRASKSDGDTTTMIEQRLAAYYDKMKLAYISTPRLHATSNINPIFLKGDQRFFNVPCPCCGEQIVLLWSVDIEGTEGKEKGGIHWKTDNAGRLDRKSVGYVCQKCGDFFDESHKREILLAGEWIPTAIPVEPGYYSYHISNLYAPPGMYDWTHYVQKYLEACPPGQAVNESKLQAHVNLCEGLTFEPTSEAPKANDLQKNTRNYEVETVPEQLSIADGNGRIVLMTCAMDMNGTEDDARIDYEVVAWAESGSTYSVDHGSIGTFIPKENSLAKKVDRARMSYYHDASNSVWPEVTKLLTRKWRKDTGKELPIVISGIDCGYLDKFAYGYIDRANTLIVGLKGDKESKATLYGADKRTFKPARERSNLYLLEVNLLKDDLAKFMRLRWDDRVDNIQPDNFMNFPHPGGGKYEFKNFYQHFEAEHKVVDKDPSGNNYAFRWKKKRSNVMNHQMDTRVYNMALRDILLFNISKENKELKGRILTWVEYVSMLIPKK